MFLSVVNVMNLIQERVLDEYLSTEKTLVAIETSLGNLSTQLLTT